jgi:hypothetical protein
MNNVTVRFKFKIEDLWVGVLGVEVLSRMLGVYTPLASDWPGDAIRFIDWTRLAIPNLP